ncbi:helicase associated domain protein [Rhodococcus sp. Br-6]|nr:helicase associated domain protein [Rhodococcus sp. Br-6]
MRNEQRFTDGVAHLRMYVTEHGHGQVPRSYVSADGFRLGRWIAVKRAAIRSNNPAMTPERVAVLLAAGFVLDAQPRPHGPTSLHRRQWDTGLAHLAAYAAEHGHADVPRRYTNRDGFALGMWVQTRRKEYRAGRLTDSDRIATLNQLGFVWESGRRGGFTTSRPQPDPAPTVESETPEEDLEESR